MHIPPFDNKNIPIIDVEDTRVPLNYFNIVNLKKDQLFEYQIPGYETCIVPAIGTINVNVEGVVMMDGKKVGKFVDQRFGKLAGNAMAGRGT